MPFLTEVCRGPSIWVLGVVVWCNGCSFGRGVRPCPYPFTSRMQRAPIINELHCDLLSGSRG